MREIKFRAWQKQYKKMWYDGGHIDLSLSLEGGLFTPDMYYNCDFEKEFILMQYTRLHDKNGVEIYEGDIFPDNGLNLVVRYELGTPVGHWHGSNEYIFFDHYANDDEVEVIGNIYENPELLK